ncbi:MAG: hypothetical protein ABI860_09920, partial [Gemmatimonadales bacterium]
MPDICFYFQVHQPYHLRHYRVFDIGTGTGYFDDEANRSILRRVADKCYIPANRLLAEAIRGSHGRFRVAMSLSGVLTGRNILPQPERPPGPGGVPGPGLAARGDAGAAFRPPADRLPQYRAHLQRRDRAAGVPARLR